MTCFIGSCILAKTLGFDFFRNFFRFVVLAVVTILIAPFFLFFWLLNPLAQSFFTKYLVLGRAWNYLIDVVADGGIGSVILLLDKMGID
jgi:hypothetical protein